MKSKPNYRAKFLLLSSFLFLACQSALALDSAAVDTVSLKKWAELAAANQQEQADAVWKNIVQSASKASDMDAVLESAISEYRFACGGIVNPSARLALVKHLDE